MRRYIYLTVFISGMTSLAVEMSASRLLENVFGTSNLVWASIIGLILIYLTLGYFLGGRWADKSPHLKTFYSILAWSGLTVSVIPAISRPVLRFSANAFDQLDLGVMLGSFLAVMILFLVPVTLMGTASPFAIRLAITDSQEAGKVSGRIYAISTLGSFLGTFLPTLLLIPTIGTYRTFFCFALILFLVAFIGLWSACGWRSTLPVIWMPLAMGVFFWFATQGTAKSSTGQIYETESAYNYIQVLEQDGYRYLRLNDGQGIHSVYHPTELNYNGPWEEVLAGPFFNNGTFSTSQIHRIAIIGLAAGTTARQATAVFGEVPIDGYEIDPVIVNVGRQYFDMNEPNLNVITEDGRWGLEHSDQLYDIISIDAYRPPYIPAHLTTQEFFQIAHDHLSENGVLVINVGRSIDDRSLIDALSTTIQTVFPSVYISDVPNSFNTMVYATVQPTQKENLALNYQFLYADENTHPLLLYSIGTVLLNLQPSAPVTTVFTDDLSPIEWITNKMIVDTVFSGEYEELQ